MIATYKYDLSDGALKFGFFQFGVLNYNTGCCLGAGFRVLVKPSQLSLSIYSTFIVVFFMKLVASILKNENDFSCFCSWAPTKQ
jgi:hypothetical protein